MITFTTRNAGETENLGERLGHLLMAGDLISLTGELGAGKTVFTRGVARGLGVRDYVKSPSYTLINEYTGRLPVYHIDLYRLEGLEDIEELGYEEYFYGKGVTIVEWGEKAGPFLPEELLRVKIEVLTAGSLSSETSLCKGVAPGDEREGLRCIVMEAEGERFRRLLEELREDVHSGS